MKVLFLDIDGVLNSETFMTSLPFCLEDDLRDNIDSQAVSVLNEIIEKSDSKIVISSTWRKIYPLPKIVEALENKGFKHSNKIIGCTPIYDVGVRGDEIQEWLDHMAIDSFAILDDDSDMKNLKPHLVQTTWKEGLQPEHIERVLNILEL
ncbi:MAG TPA: HAD domain-containing protein [Candidatus Glassbacteria bacterium]|nr:HAD domain-containing protein [Candidatus Glassbacteria bacterium]